MAWTFHPKIIANFTDYKKHPRGSINILRVFAPFMVGKIFPKIDRGCFGKIVFFPQKVLFILWPTCRVAVWIGKKNTIFPKDYFIWRLSLCRRQSVVTATAAQNCRTIWAHSENWYLRTIWAPSKNRISDIINGFWILIIFLEKRC